MKRLLDEAEPFFGGLRELVRSAEPYQRSPFRKRAVESRIRAALADSSRSPRRLLRPSLLALTVLLVAATAAAAGYSYFAPETPSSAIAPPAAIIVPPRVPSSAALPSTDVAPPPELEPQPSATASVRRMQDKLAGEDPSQVAEALRALRKQGDPARAQVLLDQYLRANPRGALAEDALALSIEAAAARKDPRSAELARRYLARYPSGRFHALAERALSR